MAADLIKDNVLSAYLGASAPAEQENDAEPRGFAGDSDLQARSAARPEVSRLASANASACRVCRSCSACAASTAQQRRRLLILCAGLLPGAQIAERAGGLSPSWPGPRCARPRAHAPGTQRPAPLRVRRARAHRSPRLRAARDTHRARLFPWQARDGRDRKRRGCGAGGPGLHARARVKPAGASAETWRRARPPPQPSRPPPPPFRCRRVRVRVRVCVSPLRSVSHA